MTANPPSRNMSGAMDLSSWGVLLGLALVWGGSFFFVEVALTHYHPLTIVAARVGLAAVFLNMFVLYTKKDWPRTARFWRMVAVLSLINNVVPFLLLVWGQTYISGGLAAILNATTPIFTVLVANRLTDDEKMTPARIAAVLLGFVGVFIILGPDMITGVDAHLLAQLAPLGAAICYAFSTVYSRRFKTLGIRPSMIATGQVSVSALILLPLAVLIDRPWEAGMPSSGVIASLLAIALFSTAIAYIAYFRFIAKNGATNMALVTFLVPVSATALGIIFLDEHILPQHGIGMLFIGLCFAVLDGRPWAMLKRKMAGQA